MPKVTVEHIKDLGFTFEMFGLGDTSSLELFIQDIIDDVSAMFEGIIGSSIYNSSTNPAAGYVKRAEKCLVASELLQRRINKVLNNVIASDDKISTKNEEQQRARYSEEAAKLIDILIGKTNFAFNILRTTHFDDTATGGVEV